MLGSQEDLLLFYQRELTYLRKMGQAFSEKYPKIAGRLQLGPHQSPDPNIERLLESFAFLTGRIQLNLENEFPELGNALLGILYPHLCNPIPSMGIAKFKPDVNQGIPEDGYLIPKDTSIFTQSQEGETCKFRTGYPVRLWPVIISAAGFVSTDNYGFLDSVPNVSTILKLTIQSQAGNLDEMNLESLRIHLDGELSTIYEIYELLFSHLEKIILLPEEPHEPDLYKNHSITPVGFETDQNLIPSLKHSHIGYGLLQEFFTFPRKFMFFDVNGLNKNLSKKSFDILFLLNKSPKKHLVINKDSFHLGCSPIINLFQKITEPIRLDHKQTEYLLQPDQRREKTTEIYSIEKVSSTSDLTDETKLYEPFYSFTHSLKESDHKAFWHGRRVQTGRKDVPGTYMYLTFLDLNFQYSKPPSEVIFAHTLCTNREFTEQLPENSSFQIEFAAPVSEIKCINKPSRQLTNNLDGAALWKLISQLSLNHLSLKDGQDGLKSLQEILRLYSASNQASTEQLIMGIKEMSCRSLVRHMGNEGWRGFCKGTGINITFDQSQFIGSSAFLFGSVLNKFFPLYSSINSFTQLSIKKYQQDGVWKIWPPMAGEKALL